MATSNSTHYQNLEGFLCPVCVKDCRSLSGLTAHYAEQHSKDGLNSKYLKDLVGKAKKKILKIDEQSLELFKDKLSESYHFEYTEPQDPGLDRSFTDYFKVIRRDKLDHRTSELNKLIIRLDKLLKCEGADRKQKEQEQVIWLDGSTVTRCPSCAATFNIARRQHHCRLCGSIMCNSCSKFLSHETARYITTTVRSDASKPHQTTPKSETNSFRICVHCMEILNQVYVKKVHSTQPAILKLYSALRSIKLDLESSTTLYKQMYDSLSAGDTTYEFQKAQDLRSTIAQQGKALRTISEQIALLPRDPLNPKLLLLQTAVEQAISQHIKDNILCLPKLPNLTDLERIRREKLLQTYDVGAGASAVVNVKKVSVATGWSPDNFNKDAALENEDNPIAQQIRNVKCFIEQAEKANRTEEVASLKKNLEDLKLEYSRSMGRRGSKNP